MFLTIITFIIVLGVLVFVHELGHFVVAKKSGVKVEEFGFGLPPRIWGIKKGETIYSINALPLGGFVKIYGENGHESEEERKVQKGRAFFDKPIWVRASILAAGVTMNLVLAAFLLGFGHWLGLPTVFEGEAPEGAKNPRVQITQIAENSPADEAGLRMGDTILGIKGENSNVKNINNIEQLQVFTNKHQGAEVSLMIQRGEETIEKKLVPRKDPPEGEGEMGVALAKTAIVSYPWYQAIAKGVVRTVELTGFIIIALAGILWDLITVGRLAPEVAGPVGIFNITGQAAHLGFIYVLQLTAILSINLAIVNAFPFPALDGGRLIFLLVEKIKGSPVSQKVEAIAHTAGFVILILLVIAITWRDVIRFF